MIVMKNEMNTQKEMIENGFKDNGQVMENVGTIRKPEFVYFGSYYRYRRN